MFRIRCTLWMDGVKDVHQNTLVSVQLVAMNIVGLVSVNALLPRVLLWNFLQTIWSATLYLNDGFCEQIMSQELLRSKSAKLLYSVCRERLLVYSGLVCYRLRHCPALFTGASAPEAAREPRHHHARGRAATCGWTRLPPEFFSFVPVLRVM